MTERKKDRNKRRNRYPLLTVSSYWIKINE